MEYKVTSYYFAEIKGKNVEDSISDVNLVGRQRRQ
jgi:hypothetical protein